MTKNRLLRKLTHAWDDFTSLFFPRLCLACSQPVAFDETFICLDCQATLPETDFHLSKKNPFTERFDGRVPVETAAALFFFTKKSKTQHLVHQIKYDDKREAAFESGRCLGLKLVQQQHFQDIDCIIPVPMHPRDRKSTRLNSSHVVTSRMPSSA